MYKIMLVEDDKILQEMYNARLEAESFEVKVAENGREAINQLKDWHPDLILLDIMMPEMNGMEVLHYLKSEPKTEKIPVFILTALGQSKDREAGLKAGADDYIVKSDLMPKEVVEKINQVLKVKSS
ncbi:MAG: response regulator [Patescibacteria group bacterium]|jgi:DNA-binding response OmpR family regulator